MKQDQKSVCTVCGKEFDSNERDKTYGKDSLVSLFNVCKATCFTKISNAAERKEVPDYVGISFTEMVTNDVWVIVEHSFEEIKVVRKGNFGAVPISFYTRLFEDYIKDGRWRIVLKEDIKKTSLTEQDFRDMADIIADNIPKLKSIPSSTAEDISNLQF